MPNIHKQQGVLANMLEMSHFTKTQALNFINGLEGPQPVIVMILDALTGILSVRKN